MDQDKLAQMLNNPLLQMSLSMMGSPAGTSLPNAIARGAGAAYTGMRNQYEDERRRAYLDQQDEYLALRKADEERQMAARASLAGALKKMPLPEVDPTSPQGQFLASTMELAQTDPDKALELIGYAAKQGLIPMPQQPEKYGAMPWHMKGIEPGSDEYERAAAIARRTAMSEPAEESMRLREESQRLREQQFALAQDRFRASQEDAGGGGGLSKTQAQRRDEIVRARRAVNKLFASRINAESFAKKNPGFQKTLDLANERMPGDDPAWETTMGARAKQAPRSADPLQARYEAARKRALDKGDMRAAKRIEAEAASQGITLSK